MIYAIWECDGHRSHQSNSFKGFFTNRKKAIKTFRKWKKEFLATNSDGWILNVGEYQPDIRLDGNATNDFNIIFSTEEE